MECQRYQQKFSFDSKPVTKIADLCLSGLISQVWNDDIKWPLTDESTGLERKLTLSLLEIYQKAGKGFQLIDDGKINEVCLEEAKAITNSIILLAENTPDTEVETKIALNKALLELTTFWYLDPPRPFSSWKKNNQGLWI